MLLNNKKIRKKYSKKYSFLETTLMDFLNWRLKTLDLKSPGSPSNLINNSNNIRKNLQLEKIRLKEFDFFSQSNELNSQEILSSRFANKTILNQTLNHKPFFLWNSFIISPGRFFPQKKVFMQYWIFPLIGFVGLTWNKSSNLFDQIHLKQSLFNSEIGNIYNPVLNKKDLNVFNNKYFNPEMKNSFYSSFSFPVQTPLKNKMISIGEKDFYEYYFLAQNTLQENIFTFESNSKSLDVSTSKGKKFTNNFDLFNKNQNLQTFSSNNPFDSSKLSTIANSFLWSKMLRNNNNLLNSSLTFNNKSFSLKTRFSYLNKDVSFLYEKNPKKIFLFPTKPLTMVQTQKIKKEPFYSIINIPKCFNVEPNKIIMEKNLKNFPIHSYEKGKFLLDNATKIFELNSKNLNINNIGSIYSLEKLKHQNYIINNRSFKSKLLDKFILLKMDQKNKQFLESKIIENQRFSLRFAKEAEGQIIDSNQDQIIDSNPENLNHLFEMKNLNPSFISNKNHNNQMVLEKIPIGLKFDLDKFLCLKKFRSKIHYKILKLDNPLKIVFLSDSNFKNLNFLIKRFKTIREKNVLNKLNKIDNQNIKNFIFEISILNYWKNSLNILNLYEKNINYPFQIFDNEFSYIRKNQKMQDLSNFLDQKQYPITKKQTFLTNNNLFVNKKFLTKLFTIQSCNQRLQQQIKKLNKTEKSEIQHITNPIITPIRLNNPIITSGSLIKPYKNKQHFSSLLSQSEKKSEERSGKIYNKIINVEKNDLFYKEIKAFPILNKECLNNFKIKYFWDMKSIQSSVDNLSEVNTNSYFYKSFINAKENNIKLNFYRKNKKLLGKFISKPIIFKIKDSYKFKPLKNTKKVKNNSMSFILHLKKLWFINLNTFINQFNSFLSNLLNILYSKIKDFRQDFKKILYYESKLGALNYKSSLFYTKSNDMNSLKVKLIKRKKQFKNRSIQFENQRFSISKIFDKVQNFKTNLKKNKKEKIFRTLLSYKSNNKDSKNMVEDKSQKYIKPIKSKNLFIRLQRRMKKLRFIGTFKNKNQFIQLKILNKKSKTFNNFYGKNKKREIISFKFEKSKNFSKILESKKEGQILESKIIENKKFSKGQIKDSNQIKNKSSLNHLFRRIGFIFLSELKFKENLSFRNNYKLSILKRFENDKSLQKKRRRKKLKLETRRRKKRKRFYPRPVWLRYSLYTKFLTKRHFYKDSSFKPKNQKSIKNLTTLKLNKDNQFSMFKSFIRSQKLKNKIYRNNKKKWGNFIQDTPKFEKIALKKFNFFSYFPIYQNKEYYKVSNRILAEFQPLCWKSYWLRSNLTPYMNRIQNNFNQMKAVEKNNNFSNINSFLLKILGFFSYDYSYNMLEILPFYSDFKNSFDSQHEFYVSNLSIFENINKISEYNRIEFERLSEILKNVKFNMNLEGQNKPKSYKFMAWKYLISLREFKNQNKKNFWNRLAYNMEPNLSSVSPFVILSNIPSNTNSSLKPYKSNATLRVLWSFNKTNQFTFKEKNQIRDLWETSKLRDQLKSNQTKKFLTNLLKVKNYLYFKDIFSQSENNLRIEDFRIEDSRPNHRFQPRPNPRFQPMVRKKFKKFKKMNSATVKKYQTIQKKLVLMTLFQPKSRMISYKGNVQNHKFISIYNNMRLLNPKIRNLKLNLDKNLLPKMRANKASEMERFRSLFSKNQKKQDTYYLWDSKPRLLKPSSFFWWSSKNYCTPFNLNAFNSFDTIYKKSYNKIDKTESSLNHFIISNILIFSILFHLSILFSFARIPELRGLLKFQFLLFYKISNNYFIVLYSIYNLLTKYKKQMFMVYKNFYKKSYNLFYKNHMFALESKVVWNQTFKNSQLIQFNSIRKSLIFDIKDFRYQRFLKGRIIDLALESKIQGQIKDYNPMNSNNLNGQIFEWNLNFPKIINKDWKLYGLSLKNKTNSFVQRKFSETPFIYSFSYNFLQSFYSNKLLNPLISNKTQLNHSLKVLDGLKFNFKKIYLKNLLNQGFSFITFQTQFALFFLFLSYHLVRFSSFIFEASYHFLLKIIDLFESFLLIIYKFLEKPAELMVEWIAQIFLIEWSSDVSTFIPETFDMCFWNSFQKFFGHSRILGFVEFQNSTNIYHFMNTLTFSRFYGNSMPMLPYELNMEKKMPFLSSFSISNIAGFFIQRRLWHFFHLFIDSILKPDIDLMVRQKKGKIFWDIWAEILIRAAEQYNINIPSLTSLKEEQEKLIERLIQDPAFVSFYQNLENNELFISLDKKDKKSVSISFKTQNKGFVLKTRSKIAKQTSYQKSLIFENKDLNNLSLTNLFKNSYKTKSWSSNQYITFNLKDTDLFLDISPPKSLLSVNFINRYEPIQYTLGSIMCEIYSGLFPMKVSKNLLIVNSQVSNISNPSYKDSFNAPSKILDFRTRGSYGSLIIQALAGESEMKMMIDNANRYASIQRGIAVGMKLLRDVFESIVLKTPCFFLMEDIHVIGERRPMLISDDENSKAAISVFGFGQDEESEKNQMIYQSSRHSINDYRRPYKGDFSMLIPTNLYNKDLYSFKKFKTNLKLNQQKKYPISLPSVENILNEQAYNTDKNSNKSGSFNVSCLQMSSESFFAPPSTSPFTILMMKEQKKLKPKKIVKQTLWNSFVAENIISSRPDSIRAKVAILADMTLRNFSVKLDMITDLLVIIDSVRSNRGFVVFATTHLPSVLDPALRRPGRFDETISLPLIPNLMNRWSLFQMNFNGTAFQNKYSRETFDQFEYGNLTENFHLTKINNLISKTKLSIFNNYNYPYIINNNLIRKSLIFERALVSNIKLNTQPKIHSSISNENNKMLASLLKSKNADNFMFKKIIHPSQAFQSFFIDPNFNSLTKSKTSIVDGLNTNQYKNSKKAYSQLSFGYFQIGNILIISDFLKDQTAFSLYNKSLILDQSSPFVYHTLYSSLNSFKTFLMRFLGGKIAEFLITKNPRKIFESKNKKNIYYSSLFDIKNIHFSTIDQQVRYKSWHFATSWIFVILQKRFLYHKNLIITKMLSFDNPNQSSLREPPSPPASSLLMPSKKYENFKRVERDFGQKSVFSIYEKMQMHQKQRFLKKLYNKPVLDSFKSQLFENRITSFDSCFKEFAYNKESILLKSSSSSFYYKNRLNVRHRFSLINQWWNGQLAEHNVEVTYLSDIDWRTMYIQSNLKSKTSTSSIFSSLLSQSQEKSGREQNFKVDSNAVNSNQIQNQKIDSILDFPDADQHYNPRIRRWFLNANSWNYWLNFETNFYYEIYYHMIYDSFNKTSIYFNENRELLDFFVSIYLQKGSLKELDFIFIFSRFYR